MTIRTTRALRWVCCAWRLRPDRGSNTTETNQAPAAPVNQQTAMPPPPAAGEAPANVGLPDDRTPLEEPNGPIDPKSAEAAGQVVQHYGALIEQGRWTESWKLWSNADAAKAFDRNWRDDTEVHMEIGKPGDTEGAAGSIYVDGPGGLLRQEKERRRFPARRRRHPAAGQRRARARPRRSAAGTSNGSSGSA